MLLFSEAHGHVKAVIRSQQVQLQPCTRHVYILGSLEQPTACLSPLVRCSEDVFSTQIARAGRSPVKIVSLREGS